jgi:energy-coupling factor transport system substrate-specific component
VPSAATLNTRALLICAAIGVATGIVAGIASAVTIGVIAVTPYLYGLVLGSHVLPGIIAQEVMRRPLVALITHLFAALVGMAFNPAWAMRFIGTALLFGAIQEGVAALTRYRAWGRWRFYVSAVIIGGIVAAVVALVVDLGTMESWVQVSYLAISVLGPVVWTAVGIAIGDALRRAGITTKR